MTRNAIDASVVLAWLLSEPRPDWVDRAMDQAHDGRLALIAPSLFWLEVGNRLSRSVGAVEFALEAMLRTEALDVHTIELDRPVRLRALHLAHHHAISMYDAAYLAVAEADASPLLTLDQRLNDAARSMGLGRDGDDEQVSEPVAAYGDGRQPDGVSIAAIGAALAEMRREYSL